MSYPSWPDTLYPPQRVRATPNITPFTYRDGETYLEVLERLRQWLQSILVPGLDDIIDFVNQAIQDALDGVEQDIANLTEYVDNAVQQVIENSIEVQDPVVEGLVKDDSTLTGSAVRVLTRQRTNYISVMDYGVAMDSSTDDTEAWQMVLDNAPRGSTILLPSSMSGAQWSRITETLVITTDSLRIVGPSSYMYNGGFLHEIVDGPMFRVEAAGVQFENFSVSGRSNKGTDPVYGNQIGIDFWGKPSGDIDSRMSHCSFLDIGTGVITRGRNLTIEQTLFGGVATAWDQRAKQSDYHDMDQPNVIRGNIFRANRIHGCGTSESAIINVEGHDDYRLGSVESSLVDNFCEGTFIRLEGSTGNSVRGFRVIDNQVTQQSAPLIDANYVDTLEISNNQFYGSASPGFIYNAINLSNADATQIIGNVFTRVARHAVNVENSRFVSMLSNSIYIAGEREVGNGITLDSASSNFTVKGLVVDGATGYGIAGSPQLATVDGVTIRATEGDVDSTTIMMPRTTIAGIDMENFVGTATVLNRSSYPVMGLPPGEGTMISSMMSPPHGARQMVMECVFTTTTAQEGVVHLQFSQSIPGDGINNEEFTTGIAVDVSAGAQLHRVRCPVKTRADSDIVGVRLIRAGAGDTDTYGYDIGVVSMSLVQTQ